MMLAKLRVKNGVNNMNFYKKILKVVCLAIYFNNAQAQEEQQVTDHLDFWARSMIETFHLVKNKSYYPVEFKDSIIKALDAFVQMDKYSKFLGPKEYDKLKTTTNGQFYGIGVVLGPKKHDDDFLLILDLKPDSPAFKSGLKPYDKIIAIDNKVISDINTEEVLNKLRGEKRYSKVTLNVMRDSNQLLTFTIERDIVKEENVVCYQFKEQKTLYCSISLFTHQTTKQLKKIIRKAKTLNLNGLILDLRDNAGGLLNSAVDCASIFIKKGSSVVLTKNRDNSIQDKFNTEYNPIFNKKIPTIILVNNFTASAAEILAGVLKLYSQKCDTSNPICNPYIYLLGTTTHGKGSVQEVIPVSNNCALKITTCLYYLPDDKVIENVGIQPDFYIEQKYPPNDELKMINKLYAKKEDKTTTKKNKDSNVPNWKKQKLEAIKNDYQIQSALNVISLLELALNSNKKLVDSHNKALNFIKTKFITEDHITPTEM